jgi:hypothetical protein
MLTQFNIFFLMLKIQDFHKNTFVNYLEFIDTHFIIYMLTRYFIRKFKCEKFVYIYIYINSLCPVKHTISPLEIIHVIKILELSIIINKS